MARSPVRIGPKPSPAAAITLPMNTASAITGLSRAAIYRAAADGRITLKKLGRSTLVDMDTARAFLAALPEAAIRHKQAA